MKVLIAIIFILFAGAAVFIYLEQKGIEEQMRTYKEREYQVIKFDSLRSIVESRIYDSLSVITKAQNSKIQSLESDLKREHKQNEQIQKRLNSISVSLPQF
jgi:uncharacterized protein HemX